MGWVSQEAANKVGRFNQAWFDIPNGWTADTPGIVSFGAASAGGGGEDSALYLHGFEVSSRHQTGGWGYTHNCLVPRGAVITISSNQGSRFLIFKRLN